MDKISELPDELLVKILSSVPTKVAVSTSILSKRWKFLWMWLPKLEYTDDGQDTSLLLLRDFINKNLPLHRSPVIELLCLDLWEQHDPKVEPGDIKTWVEIAVSRNVRELEVSCWLDTNVNMIPSSLFTCKSLVVLKLRYMVLNDVPSMVCLPSLKTLHLQSVTYLDCKSFENLVSMCHVLEDLEVHFLEDDFPQMFAVKSPLLRKLSLSFPDCWYLVDEYEIDTPRLEYLKLEELNENVWLFKNMPNLREAYLDGASSALKNVARSITSVKRLTVCSEVTSWEQDGFVFNQLEHLNLCVCRDESLDLLMQFLKDSPNLRVLDISVLDCHGDLKTSDMVHWWDEPRCVPECILSSLQVFNWSRYSGRPQDRVIAGYILSNARHLRKATFEFDRVQHDVAKLKMLKRGLALASRASSSTCELVFVE